MMDSRLSFVSRWNKLNKRYNELVNKFTLNITEYQEFRIIYTQINELLNEDAFYFGFEELKMGQTI